MKWTWASALSEARRGRATRVDCSGGGAGWIGDRVRPGQHPGNIGKAAPEFVMSDGVQTVDLVKLRGRIVVLNLWATWCAPCVEELPSLLALQRRMPELAVVAVSTDQDDDVYRRFLQVHHVDVRTVRDSEMTVNQMYGTVQIPETYIIDRNGVIRRKFIGAQDWTGDEIGDYLRKL